MDLQRNWSRRQKQSELISMPAKNSIGKNPTFFEPVQIGFPSREHLGKEEWPGAKIGDNCTIRSGTIIYSDVIIGDNCQTGHNTLIREHTVIGNHTAIGTAAVIDGNVTIGHDVSIQSQAYIPPATTIGNHVFIGPNVVITNDRYPPTGIGGMQGATIEDYAAIGANSTLVPGVKIGRGAFVAAGSVVTKDVPPYTMAMGNPARHRDLPEQMKNRKEE